MKIQESVDQSPGDEEAFWSRWGLILSRFQLFPESIEYGQLGTLTWEPSYSSLGQPRRPSGEQAETLVKRGDFLVRVHVGVKAQGLVGHNAAILCHPGQVCWRASSMRAGTSPCPVGSTMSGTW